MSAHFTLLVVQLRKVFHCFSFVDRSPPEHDAGLAKKLPEGEGKAQGSGWLYLSTHELYAFVKEVNNLEVICNDENLNNVVESKLCLVAVKISDELKKRLKFEVHL